MRIDEQPIFQQVFSLSAVEESAYVRPAGSAHVDSSPWNVVISGSGQGQGHGYGCDQVRVQGASDMAASLPGVGGGPAASAGGAGVSCPPSGGSVVAGLLPSALPSASGGSAPALLPVAPSSRLASGVCRGLGEGSGALGNTGFPPIL